eukprot:Plantae.Rhodophyta-Hildenbrandia_rubra.ctg32787.p1 GENE.Plantae.Rhodophyta-Hildenbrandia_rubra.ctg32787~~Plantae.Rhodophyta-Hildenbrandia_rubra.ctg32787.p1  ORF type:complete len:357 (-),score=74.80 Plantae.Rhodophyta-Hildenbrandia_rubra.ctg32787:905-1918(-)
MPLDKPIDAPASCPGTKSESAGKSDTCVGCPNQAACASGEAAKPDPALAEIVKQLKEPVSHKILVMSGKGGVGKSTLAAQVSLALSVDLNKDEEDEEDADKVVGLLDVDICGPSMVQMMGLKGREVVQSGSGWQPVYVDEHLCVMSIGFMLPDQNSPIAWRGARKTGMIKTFLKDVDWGELDYLIVDSPPGTSDEHITLVQCLRECDVDGALIVTTPQEVSLLDVRKEINFCKKAGIKVLGVVENMAGFVCPHCSECSEIFFPSSGGAEKMCKEMQVPYLGKIPLDPAISQASELGKSVFESAPDSKGVIALNALVKKIRASVEGKNLAMNGEKRTE